MAELTETVKVSRHIKDKLLDIKEKDQHSSMDSVIRSLLQDSEAYQLLKERLEKNEAGKTK